VIVVLDEVGGLARKDVEAPQLPLRRLVRVAPVGGHHPQHLASPRAERGGLHRTNARLAIHLQVFGAGHVIARFDVGRDDPPARTQCFATGARGFEAHALPEAGGLRAEVTARQ
jgi:hypothetical protein